MNHWYSVRMRAAQGGPHEEGGHHISGAEALISADCIEKTALEMINRALSHARGESDFIQLKIEKLNTSTLPSIQALPVQSVATQNQEEAINQAITFLLQAGVSKKAAQLGLSWIHTDQSTRGAVVLNALSGERMDLLGTRGVRVSRFSFEETLQGKNFEKTTKNRQLEALALATKVHAANTIAELCCSDDPNYSTGYVSTDTYYRIPHLKKMNSICGGRVFFVQPDINMEEYVHFLEKKPVLIRGDLS